MLGLLSAVLLSLPLAGFAANSHQGSLRHRHIQHARSVSAIERRSTQYKLVDDYNNSTFFK